MRNDSFTKYRMNHNCLSIATTESVTEFSPSLYPIIIRCQDSLKNLWLWCNTTKCANLEKFQMRQKGG